MDEEIIKWDDICSDPEFLDSLVVNKIGDGKPYRSMFDKEQIEKDMKQLNDLIKKHTERRKE